MKNYEHPDKFLNRHIGPGDDEISQMLKQVGVTSVKELIEKTIPADIISRDPLVMDEPLTEYDFLNKLNSIASLNKVYKSYIGMGYHPVIMPQVIKRNILENPGWYTQYTPYQAEIAQGRLEALLIFQTMINDLTAMEISNASLLDEGTAAAEAMILCHNISRNKNSTKFFVSENCFPQTIEVLKTRAVPLNIEIVIGDHKSVQLDESYIGLLVQYPDGYGEIYDYTEFFGKADKYKIKKVVAADLLSLTLLKPPGEFGADVVVGSSQRFGVPMGFGGPHAAFFATKDEFKRFIPGRIIGVSIDASGNPAFRMALQTREQHIRREKATSNICTAQVLLAIIAAMYAVYHGPVGLKKIAERIHSLTSLLQSYLQQLGFIQLNENYFDTLRINTGEPALTEKIRRAALKRKINFRYIDDRHIGISLNELTGIEDVLEIVSVFEDAAGENSDSKLKNSAHMNTVAGFAEKFKRQSVFLQHPSFNTYHSETEMMRFLKSLENKDLSLVHSMIALGSCTMKLNAATEMAGISWKEFSDIHPFVPRDQAEGYLKIFEEFNEDLKKITGFQDISLQPNSGAQGEYTGLMVIREFHRQNGEGNRNIVLIPSSAHGTNPASAVMAGMKVVVVNCDSKGNIDIEDLKKKAEANKDNLAALMVTYPSTHGVFESGIREICEIIHQYGGQVYMDGANLNAQVGYTSPLQIGADVCHLNLHKTFCIPHGGGGPGMGPIAVANHLVPFLPGHPVIKTGGNKSITAVSSAPWGSPLIVIISYAYIKMMGAEGLKKATAIAILNANYIKARLEPYYKVLYTGTTGRVAHELIFDMREFKSSAKIEVEDIAKRLMDYGYHAPTVSFPVPGTLMVEPTESESKDELDRFCDALISIREEIREIENGTADPVDNVLKNAPHTLQMLMADNWFHKYSREKAAFPLPWTRKSKFWPSVARVDNAYGDRHLVCSCIPVDEFVEEHSEQI